VQVEPMKPKLKPPGTKRSKLKCGILLSTSAFKISLRRYNEGYYKICKDRGSCGLNTMVGRCRLTLSNPR